MSSKRNNILKHKILILYSEHGHRQTIQNLEKSLENKHALHTLQLHPKNNFAPSAIDQYTDFDCIISICTNTNPTSLEVVKLLKSNFQTCHIPIILLAAATKTQGTIKTAKLEIEVVAMGADDYIIMPFDNHNLKTPFCHELKIRIEMNILRAQRDIDLNPLTQLPGNNMINKTINQSLNQPLAILYADIDNFKAYNDKYGFNKGDELILHTAKTLRKAIQKNGNSNDFLGHIGGDDFVIVSTPDKAIEISQQICKEFDKAAPQFYNDQDRKNKKNYVLDRRGNKQEFPLASVSIAIVTNERRSLESIAQISQIAAEMKCYAKSKPDGKLTASSYAKDQRSG
jgi:diguanylate cyclase (GGDEF)-like protein